MNETCNCCCCCNETNEQKEVKIEYLYLDLKTCDRCIGTDAVLEEVIKELTPAFELAGYKVRYDKTEIKTETDAILFDVSNDNIFTFFILSPFHFF